MAKYRITAPDGKTIEVEGPDDATEEELQQFAGQQFGGKYRNNPVEVRPPARELADNLDKAGGKLGYADLITEGASFGLYDEASGVANALMHPTDLNNAYTVGRDAQRLRLDDARQRTGWTGTVAEVGGGFLGGLPSKAGSALLSLGQAAKAGLKTGAIGGAVGGFGYGDGPIGSLIQAGAGALVGGGIGAALPVAANLVTNRLAAAGRLAGRDTQGLARQIVGQAIEADGSTPATVGQRLMQAAERGTPLSVADTGDNARGLLASVSRRPGPARSLARGAIESRQAEQSDRVLGAIGENLGPIRGMRQQSDELMQQARAAAAPLYDQAYQTPVISTPELDSLLNTPAGRGALGRARTIAANERRDPQALGFVLDENDQVRLDPTLHLHEDGSISQEPTQTRGYTPQTLDYVKRGLDDIIESHRDPVTGRLVLDEAGRAINGVRAGLLREVDKLNPAYGEARAAYAGPASAEEALQLGRKSLNASAEDIEAATGRMTDEQRQQFALGFRAAMADNIGRATDGANVAQRMLGTPRKRQALASVFGGEENFNRFLSTVGDERATNETYRSVMSGSQTAERMAADAQTSDGGLLETAGGAALRGVSQPIGLLGDALKALGELDRFGVGEAGDRTRESVAALLTEANPEVLVGLSKAIKDATTRQRLRNRTINRTVGKIGAGVGNEASYALDGLLSGSSTQ